MSTLPETIWDLLVRTPEQSGILSYDQLPVSFTEVLHRTTVMYQNNTPLVLQYAHGDRMVQGGVCLPDSLGSSAVFPPSACLSLSYASTETD